MTDLTDAPASSTPQIQPPAPNAGVSAQPFVCAVVASYNRAYIISETLRALLGQNYPPNRFEVVVVDNASTDNTLEVVRSEFADHLASGKLKVHALEANTGSAGSYIHALEVANDSWEYLLKMDEDLVLDPGCLSALVECAVRHVDVGMVGGKVYFYKQRDVLNGVGSFFRPYYAIARGIGVGEKDVGQYDLEQEFDGLAGCMVLISRKLKETVGWFDPDYFLYYDDHELMFRGRRAGLRNIFTPSAIGFHDTGTATSAKYSNPRWLFYSTRGAWMFYYKNFHCRLPDAALYMIGMHALFARQTLRIIMANARNPSDLVANLLVFARAYCDGAGRRTRGFVDRVE